MLTASAAYGPSCVAARLRGRRSEWRTRVAQGAHAAHHGADPQAGKSERLLRYRDFAARFIAAVTNKFLITLSPCEVTAGKGLQ